MAIDGFFPETEMPDAGWWRVLWADPSATLRALGVTPGLAAVDLCCGDGTFTTALARLTGRTVHAIDINPACLDRARPAVRRDGEGDCRFALSVMRRLVPGDIQSFRPMVPRMPEPGGRRLAAIPKCAYPV